MKKALVPLITNLNLGGKPVVLTDGEIRIAERPNEILAVDVSLPAAQFVLSAGY